MINFAFALIMMVYDCVDAKLEISKKVSLLGVVHTERVFPFHCATFPLFFIWKRALDGFV